MTTESRPERPALRVRDIMRRDVVTVPPDLPVREAARRLWDRGISGAAVVDEKGDVVGVISATDLLRAEAYGLALPGEGDRFPSPGEWVAAAKAGRPAKRRGEAAEPPEPVRPADYRVGDVMMPATFAVRETATVQELARFLLNAGVHRALVMEGRRLQGIVTTFDVLRAVVGGDALHR